jgi:hypothetical protein
MAKWEEAYRSDEEPDEPSPKFDPSADPAIENEPHLRGGDFQSDPSEAHAGKELDPLGATPSIEDRLEASVWDEPAIASGLGVAPAAGDLTYDRWLTQGEEETSPNRSWWICLIVAAISGPAAVLGTFFTQSTNSIPPVMMICLVGPLVEEVMKAASILWVVEKRPFFFKTPAQIVVCGIMSGLVFAAIENLLYLNVYIPNPTPGLATWRWTVCVALHTGCTCISAFGLRKVWQRTMAERTRPNIAIASTYIIAAVLTHAIYNTAATLFSGLAEF